MMNSDYYKVLGVKCDATQNEIKKAYYRLCQKHHQDKCFSPDEKNVYRKLSEKTRDGKLLSQSEKKQLAELKEKLLPFNLICVAYKVLFDSEKRELYDRKRREENNGEASEKLDEEFDTFDIRTFDELSNILSKAVNDNDYGELNEVISNDRCYVLITDLNSNNFKAFCSQYLNLDLYKRSDHKYIYNNILSKYNLGTEGSHYNFSEKELILLAIAANDKLAAEYQGVLLNQEDLELESLLLLVCGQKYIDILSDKLKEKDNGIKAVSPKFFPTIALRKEFNQLFAYHITEYLNTLKNDNIVNTIRNILDTASSVQNKKCIEILLMSSKAAQVSNANLLYLAACYSREKAQVFLDDGIGVDVKDGNGMAPLHFIARNACQVAQKDTNNGWFSTLYNWLPFSSSSAGNGDTALFREGIEFLLGKGADIDAKDNSGMTPLHFAVCNGNLEMVKFLVEKGADFNLTCENKTVLDLARLSRSENKEKVIKFFEEEVEIKKRTPLHYAILSNNSKTLKLFLEQERFINDQDSRGYTPLGLAIEKSKLEAVKLLLNHKAYFDFSYLRLVIEKLKVLSEGDAIDIFDLLAEKLKKEFDETKTQFMDKEKALNITNEKVSQLQKELEKTRVLLRQKQESTNERLIQEQQQKISQLNDQVDNRTKELKGAKAQLVDLQNNLDDAKQDLAAKTRELDEAKVQFEENLNEIRQSLKGSSSDNGNKKFSGVNAQSRKQITYASISLVLSGTFAVCASLTMFHLAMCISLAVAALIFLAVGFYCSYKANTALSNVEVENGAGPTVTRVLNSPS